MSTHELISFKVSNGDFPPCDREVFQNGKVVVVCAHGKDVAESACRVLRHEGWRVDWHFVRGRVHVKSLDDDLVGLRKRWFQLVTS